MARPELWRQSSEYVIMNVLRWANNRKDAHALAWELHEISSEALGQLQASSRRGGCESVGGWGGGRGGSAVLQPGCAARGSWQAGCGTRASQPSRPPSPRCRLPCRACGSGWTR